MKANASLLAGLSRNVVILGLVSLFQDASSEMLYPIVPMFLVGVLGAPMTVIGLIEGFAEFTAAILKAVFGRLSDRWQRRSVFISLGYGLSAASRPLLFLANTWGFVLASRLLDRLGKGVRTSPRDALLAASAPPEHRGKVFGLHRAMDTIGAVVGPLLAIWLLDLTGNDYRFVFLIAIIPTALAFSLTFLVKEIKTDKLKSERASHLPIANRPLAHLPLAHLPLAHLPLAHLPLAHLPLAHLPLAHLPLAHLPLAHLPLAHLPLAHLPLAHLPLAHLPLAHLPLAYWKFLAINTIFFLGNSSDVFLILRAQETGLSAPLAILAYVVYNLAYALLATPAGMISDRLGRRGVMQTGFLVFAIVYFGFAVVKSTSLIWPLFALYGFYAAMTEGISKAAIADLVAPAHRGSAIGVFYMSTGVAALVASSLAGWLWQELGATVALGFSTMMAMTAFLLLLGWKEGKTSPA